MAVHKGKERRKYPRIKKTIAVNVIAVKTAGKDEIKTLPKIAHEVGLNIAEGGVLIECGDLIAQDSNLTLKILLPDDKPPKIIDVKGKIIWSKQIKRKGHSFHYYGIQFKDLKKGSAKAIAALRKAQA